MCYTYITMLGQERLTVQLQDINLQEAIAKSGLTPKQIEVLDGGKGRVMSITDFMAVLPPKVVGGYALGRYSPMHEGISSSLGMLVWNEVDTIRTALRNNYDKSSPNRVKTTTINQYMQELVEEQKPIVFFIPRENSLTTTTEQGDLSVTTRELQWILNKLQAGADLGEVYFVFGLYDVIAEDDMRKLWRAYPDSENGLRRAIGTIFSKNLPSRRGTIS